MFNLATLDLMMLRVGSVERDAVMLVMLTLVVLMPRVGYAEVHVVKTSC